MRIHLWLNFVLVVVLSCVVNVTCGLPLLSPAVFVTRNSPHGHHHQLGKHQLAASKVDIRPISGKILLDI